MVDREIARHTFPTTMKKLRPLTLLVTFLVLATSVFAIDINDPSRPMFTDDASAPSIIDLLLAFLGL